MNQGATVFAQIMDFYPMKKFRQCVNRYYGNHRVRSFSSWDQFLYLAFVQLTFRESQRDIECCLQALQRIYPTKSDRRNPGVTVTATLTISVS
jgi:hypothetical protein